MKNKVTLLAGLLIFSNAAYAVSNAGEQYHTLSVAGGIAHPSVTSAVFQNPAGIHYNQTFKLMGEFLTTTSFDDPEFGGGLLFGNGMYGGHVGVRHSTAGDGATAAVYGLGVYADSLKFGLGIGGSTVFSGSTSINIGALINSYGKLRFGATVFDVSGGVSAIGAGVAYDLANYVSLVGDVAANTDFDTFRIKPGLIVGSAVVSLTASYGLDIGDGAVGGFEDEFSAGVSVTPTRVVNFQVYYNQLSELYASFSLLL